MRMNETQSSRPSYGLFASAVRITSAFALVALLSAPYMLLCVVLFPWRGLRIRAGNGYGKMVGRIISSFTGIKPSVSNREGIEGSAPALFVCNHTSTIDMWIGMWLCPYRGCGVAKREIIRIPFFGQAYLLSGNLLLDRGNRQKAVASMERVAKVVRKHRLSLWMWPEGTRSRDGRLQPLKKGFVHLAIATGLPVVPVVFHDADLHWQPGRFFRLTPGELKIEVLDPIDTSGWKTEHVAAHAEELWSKFQDTLGPRQRGVRVQASATAVPAP